MHSQPARTRGDGPLRVHHMGADGGNVGGAGGTGGAGGDRGGTGGGGGHDLQRGSAGGRAVGDTSMDAGNKRQRRPLGRARRWMPARRACARARRRWCRRDAGGLRVCEALSPDAATSERRTAVCSQQQQNAKVATDRHHKGGARRGENQVPGSYQVVGKTLGPYTLFSTSHTTFELARASYRPKRGRAARLALPVDHLLEAMVTLSMAAACSCAVRWFSSARLPTSW